MRSQKRWVKIVAIIVSALLALVLLLGLLTPLFYLI